jgi:hypothetical protein
MGAADRQQDGQCQHQQYGNGDDHQPHYPPQRATPEEPDHGCDDRSRDRRPRTKATMLATTSWAVLVEGNTGCWTSDRIIALPEQLCALEYQSQAENFEIKGDSTICPANATEGGAAYVTCRASAR